jgi:hypothetical protein
MPGEKAHEGWGQEALIHSFVFWRTVVRLDALPLSAACGLNSCSRIEPKVCFLLSGDLV